MAPRGLILRHPLASSSATGLYTASSWLFFPGMGNSDIDFHYWSVQAAHRV